MMQKTAKDNKAWTKPELKRLGTVKDVSVTPPGVTQGASGKS